MDNSLDAVIATDPNIKYCIKPKCGSVGYLDQN